MGTLIRQPGYALALLLTAAVAGCGGGSGGGSGDGAGGDSTTGTGGDADTGSDTDSGSDSDNGTLGYDQVSFGSSLDILVLGTSETRIRTDAWRSQWREERGQEFEAGRVAQHLQKILDADAGLSVEANVTVDDIYASKSLTFGYGSSGTWEKEHYRHSLAQYYYWPEGRDARMQRLAGTGGTEWDFVVITADPYYIEQLPGYYALGVNKVAEQVAQGGGQPLLLMQWPDAGAQDNPTEVGHYREFTYRVGRKAGVDLPVVPAGLAWDALPAEKKDTDTRHPTPNGAYLSAAAIYAHLLGKSASGAGYTHDDAIADHAFDTADAARSQNHFSGERTFLSPFAPGAVSGGVLNFEHSGTSTERGIRRGLGAVGGVGDVPLAWGGDDPIDFHYGRANQNFEDHKEYRIDPDQYDFGLGFPMQDGGSTGDRTMLYGLDKRQHWDAETDVGVAEWMISQGQLPHARAIPIRTLFAQIKEIRPGFSAYSDNWHMSGRLNKATASYIYTLMTGDCAVYDEPQEENSDAWRDWISYKVGYETAWTLMHASGKPP